MKNLLLLTSLFASLFFIVNCSPNKSSTGSVSTATANGACPVGYYYSNGQCYSGNSSTGANYNYGLGFYSDNYSGYVPYFQVVNVNLLKQFFKLGMGVCDRNAHDYGVADCDYYVQGQTDIIIQLPSDFNVANSTTSSALVTVFARPKNNPYYQYQASFGPWWSTALGALTGIYLPNPNYYSGAYRNPLQIQMSTSPVNANQGFSASGYGDAWTGYNQTLVTIEVLNGNQNSPYIDYNLKIGGQTAITGRMARCQTTNCGI